MNKLTGYFSQLTTVSLTVFAFVGSLGGVFTYLWGPWNKSFAVMLIVMLVDLITGILTACKGKSSKSKSGKYSSKAGKDGLMRKAGLLAIVLLANVVGSLGPDNTQILLREGAVFSVIFNESVSILENFDALGWWVPPIVKKYIELQKKKADELVVGEDEKTGDSE